jgi:sortase A
VGTSAVLAEPVAAALSPVRGAARHLSAVRSSAIDPVPPVAEQPPPAPAAVPSHAAARQLSSSRLVVGVTIWILGGLLVSFVGYLAGLSSLIANRSQAVLFDKIRYELAHGTAPTVAALSAGQPVAVITIPSLHLRQVVVEGSNSRDLMTGPGVEPGTPLPGQLGTSVILGRRETFGAPFRQLNALRHGDLIDVASGAGALVYKVDESWRSNQKHNSTAPTSSRITLITSDPGWRASGSVVVTAALSTGQPGAANATTVTAANDQPLSSDHDGALSLYLWSQLAFLAVVAVVRYHGRVRRSVLWVGGMPLLVVVLLHIYPALAALLPNTL